MKRLRETEVPTGVPLSERVVPVALIQTAEQSYKVDDDLGVALILIACLAEYMHSPDAMALSFRKAAKLCGREDLLMRVWKVADEIRKGNSLSGMF